MDDSVGKMFVTEFSLGRSTSGISGGQGGSLSIYQYLLSHAVYCMQVMLNVIKAPAIRNVGG